MSDQIISAALHEQAATLLVAARRSGRAGPRLPEQCRPTDIEDGWAIRELVAARLGLVVAGWKCGLPKPGRFSLAPIYAPGITRVAPVMLPIEGEAARFEPEIGFVLGRDLAADGAPYDRAIVLAAVASTHLALELIACRYAKPEEASYPELFADCLLNQGMFLGPAIDAPPAALPLTIESPAGVLQTCEGAHPDADPVAPLVWLANELARRGIGLFAGQAIITGSFAGILAVPVDTALRIRFGTLGSIEVTFRRA